MIASGHLTQKADKRLFGRCWFFSEQGLRMQTFGQVPLSQTCNYYLKELLSKLIMSSCSRKMKKDKVVSQ